MIKEIKMPAGGQTTDTATIGAWLVKKGDNVKRGDSLLEIETDKATLVVESVASGTVLAILVCEGDKASAGDIIAFIGDESDMADVENRLKEIVPNTASAEELHEELEEDEYQPIVSSKAKLFSSKKPVSENKNEETQNNEIKAMPNAKKLAKEKGIRLCDVAEYTGKSFLKKSDVLEYTEKSLKSGKSSVRPSEERAASRIPLTSMRKIIAERMLESSSSIPSFHAEIEIDMTSIINLREAINSRKAGVKVSYNDIIFKCVGASIRQYPYINSTFTDSEIIIYDDVNIGLAVSVEQGLVVPVVRDVNSKTIAEIAELNKVNIEKARAGRLTAADMQEGTLTVSNMGMYPITRFTAIINPPEVCILALGAISEKPFFKNGAFEPVKTMTITGSFDHRVIDGAYGAQFLTVLKEIMENPALAL